MTTYQGNNGTYTIQEPFLAKGGEGEIFAIRGQNDLVLKRFYAHHRTTTRHNKLQAMIRTGVPNQLLSQLTWPVDIVYEKGQFVGYVMPKLAKTQHLNVFYNDIVNASLEDLVTIAMNLCVPVDALHQLGQCVGDGNPQNICVDPKNLTITLVDTDSYSIKDPNSGRTYPCIVGLGPYLAPEVQVAMKQYHGLDRVPADTFNEYTDRFWLAVHIFALLMNGTHPFAVREAGGASITLSPSQSSVSLPQPAENICGGFFPHTMHQPGMDIPIACPKFSYLPVPVQNLFIRAFVDGHTNPSARPSAREWFAELIKMRGSITSGTKCRHKNHQYPASSAFCPWCELASRTIPKPKPAAPAGGSGTGGWNTTGTGGMNGYQNGNRHRSGFGCLDVLGILLGLLISFAILLALPVACTANMMNIHESEQAYKEELQQQKLEELRQQAEENQQNNQNQLNGGSSQNDYDQQADGSYAPHMDRVLQAGEAYCHNLSGSLSDNLTETEFYLCPANDGVYRVETTDSDMDLLVKVYDDTGYAPGYYVSEDPGDGIILEMEAGRTYTLKVGRRFADTGSFQLCWWLQKDTIDITNYGAVNDTIEFNGQTNLYRFRCSASTTWRFFFPQMAEDMRMTIQIFDTDGNKVTGAVNLGYKAGPYVDLENGKEYIIAVSAYYGSGGYSLSAVVAD